MLKLAPRAPFWRDIRPGARILFAPVTQRAWRAAKRAAGEALRSGEGEEGVVDAGDAFSRALIAAGVLEWEGFGDDDGVAVPPSHLFPVFNAAGVQLLDAEGQPVWETAVERMLDDPRLFEICDAVYVLPFAVEFGEGNGSSGSPNGISSTATPAPDTASSPATPDSMADARPVPTASTPRKRKRAEKPGT